MIFAGSGLDFDDFWVIFRATLPRKSKNLPRTKLRIQEAAEDKAEKKIRTNASKKTQISKLCSSQLLSLSQPSLLQKLWAAVLPPGGLQSAAHRGRRAKFSFEVFPSSSKPNFPKARFLESERLSSLFSLVGLSRTCQVRAGEGPWANKKVQQISLIG